MKIDANTGFPAIRKNKPVTGPAKMNEVSAERAGKTDVIEFSRGSNSLPDKNLSDLAALKSSLIHDVAAGTDPARLAALKQSVRDGSYRPSTEDWVNAIMEMEK